MNKDTMQLVIAIPISIIIIAIFRITTFPGMFLAAGISGFLVSAGFGLAAIRKQNTTNQ